MFPFLGIASILEGEMPAHDQCKSHAYMWPNSVSLLARNTLVAVVQKHITCSSFDLGKGQNILKFEMKGQTLEIIVLAHCYNQRCFVAYSSIQFLCRLVQSAFKFST